MNEVDCSYVDPAILEYQAQVLRLRVLISEAKARDSRFSSEALEVEA